MPPKILLPIKPHFAQKILDGTKQYEFRRAIFKNKNVKKIILYSSSPVQKVVGEVEIEKILEEEINELWQKTSKHSGIEYEYYKKYFKQKKKGFAIKISKRKKYKNPKCLKKDFGIHFTPQSFIYL